MDFGKPFERHWLTGFQRIKAPVLLSGSTAVIATALGAGYSHWLLEELPRLLALRDTPFDHLILHGLTSYSREAVAELGTAAKRVEARRYSHYCCEQAIIPSLIGQAGFPTPKVIRLICEFAARLSATGVGVAERVYVTREQARRRRIVNEAELWSRLERRGFIKVRAEELTWVQQIEIFRRAKVVVGAHGAGFANLVFCRPGTRVVEVFNRDYVNACYWRLASVNALDYQPIVNSGPGSLQTNLAANREDITADVGSVEAALAGF